MDKRYQGVIRRVHQWKTEKTMDKRYQGLLSIVLSVLHWFTSSYYPLVSFVHCFVCPWLIYAFLLPLGGVNQWRTDKTMDKRYQGVIRRRKSMKDRQNNDLLSIALSVLHWCTLLITPWYLLSIVLSVLDWFTPSYYSQGVIRTRKSIKDRQNNGQKIPRSNKKA
jgi:hypothetical protein